MHVKPEFSLAAMIDVIFLLLMFFMLTSNFVTTNSLQLQLPSSKSSLPTASTSLAVSIKKEGLGYQYFLGSNKTKRTDMESLLRAGIKTEIAKGQDPKSVTVTIAAEEGVGIEEVVYVLDIASRLKVKTILATKQLIDE